MDYETSLRNLGIRGNVDKKTIRDAYHKGCLRYHPDRTRADTRNEFNKIKESYDYLMENEHHYKNDNHISTHNIISDLYRNIVHGVVEMLIKNDNEKFRSHTYYMLCKINVPTNVINHIKSLVEKSQNIHNIYPTIDDILNDHVYKLDYRGDTYIIPMWWGDSIIDCKSNGTIKINMIYTLPTNVTIDNDNNIVINLVYSMKSLYNKDVIHFHLGCKIFKIKIKIIPNQTIVFHKRGMLSKMIDDIVSESYRMNVIFNLSLY